MYALCKRFNLIESFDVKSLDGIDNLFKQLPVVLKNKPKTIGIVIDADQNIEKRWESLKKLLLPLGYEFPKKPTESGTILRSLNKTTIGVWIMPNNRLSGMLEDFMKYLIPENDKLLPKAESILKELEKESVEKYKPIHRSKALIHTWLAWQEDPGTPFGLAITKKYFSTDEENCKIFINWLNELFNPTQG
jgi:hypothetical protein